MDQPDTKRDERAIENPPVKRKGENTVLDNPTAGVLQSPPTSPTRLTSAKSNHPGVSTPPRRIGIRYPKKQKVTIVLSTPPREVHRRDPSPTPSPKRVRFSLPEQPVPVLPLRTEQEPSTTTSITLDADYHSPLKRSALKRYVYLKEVLHADVQTSIPFSGASSRLLSPKLPVMQCEKGGGEKDEEERSQCEVIVGCEEEEKKCEEEEVVECEEKEKECGEESKEEREEEEKEKCEEEMECEEEQTSQEEVDQYEKKEKEEEQNRTEITPSPNKPDTLSHHPETPTTQNPPLQIHYNPEKTKPSTPSPLQEIEEVYEESSEEEEEPQPQPFSLLSFLYRSFTRLFSSPVS